MLPRCHFLSRIAGLALLLPLLALVGCQSDSDDKKQVPDAVSERPVPDDAGPETLAARYMSYAYQGALLSSEHPLNDSVATLVVGPVSGPVVTVIDTFEVTGTQVTEQAATVSVRAPHAVEVQASTWDTSPPTANKEYTLQVHNDTLRNAPHVVGYPAFARHMRTVDSAAADTLLPRVAKALNRQPPS